MGFKSELQKQFGGYCPSSIEAMVVRFRMSKLEVAQREQDKGWASNNGYNG
jgi:hypothetical protein